MKVKSADIILGTLSFVFTILFITALLTNRSFFEWVYNRHHNLISWYIRPLFLIPFCFFSYKRSFSGIGFTLLALFTSMFWFPAPDSVNEKVNEFLTMEMNYLHGSWDMKRILFTITIPVTLFLLAFALWKRELKAGLLVVVFMALIKIIWSILEGGESGTSILIPALTGLGICLFLIFIGFRFLENQRGNKTGRG